MPFRLLAKQIPQHVGTEAFYDYIRAHAGGDSITNALLITQRLHPQSQHSVGSHGGATAMLSPPARSLGAALVDYATQSAAEAAQRADFYVDGVQVLLDVVGAVAASGKQAENRGREAYQQQRYGFARKRREIALNEVPHARRPRDDNVGKGDEMTLRLVGIPTEVYGPFLAYQCSKHGALSHEEIDNLDGRSREMRSAVQLFFDVALAIRRLTAGELLSMRRVSSEESIITVCANIGQQLLDLPDSCLHLTLDSPYEQADEKDAASLHNERSGFYRLQVRQPRSHVKFGDRNFSLVRKHQVLKAISRLMRCTNERVAGFVDPFGNVLIPKC
ncbi:hypothetical protein TRVL_10219 [Trypanosoma vivax]|nr:hypothetical protein TRVL_10219 [Trypanosoma vivax]